MPLYGIRVRCYARPRTRRTILLIGVEHLPRRVIRPPVQLGLFWETLRYTRLLVINHPRPVYSEIWLEMMAGKGYWVRKTSGILGRKPDIRKREFDSLDDATDYYTIKIQQKTNPERKSPRKYQIDIETG